MGGIQGKILRKQAKCNQQNEGVEPVRTYTKENPQSGAEVADKEQDSGELMQVFQYARAPVEIVHHYIPSNFPMMPRFHANYSETVNSTWSRICLGDTKMMREQGKSGIVLYYDEFYYRLFQRDATLKEVFPTIQSRGEILIKAITLITKSSTENTDLLMNKCRYLGHRHRSFPKIRPYHFFTFVTTLIEVVMFWLGDFATPEVAEAWSNCLCFFMKYMLESMLADKVDPFEHYQNATLQGMKEISSAEDAEDLYASGHKDSTESKRRAAIKNHHRRGSESGSQNSGSRRHPLSP